MASSLKITNLFDDVIIIILENKRLHYRDVINFQSTCKRFYRLKLTKKFWEKKYYQSCYDKTKYNAEKRKKNSDHLNYKELIEKSIKCMKDLQGYESLIVSDNLSHVNEKKLNDLLSSIAKNSDIYYLVFNDVQIKYEQILRQWTNDYYSFLRLYFIFNQQLRQYRFMYKFKKFGEMPKKKKIVERLVTILIQYYLPHVSYSIINKWLDDIVEEVLSCIKNKYSTHSILSTSRENFSFWRDNQIECNYWNLAETTQMFDILEEFIYSNLFVDRLYKLLDTLKVMNFFESDICFKHDFFQSCCRGLLFNSIARRLGLYSLLGMLFDEKIVTLSWILNDEQNLDDAVWVYLKDEFFNLSSPIVKATHNGHVLSMMWSFCLSKTFLAYAMKLLNKDMHLQYGRDMSWEVNILTDILTKKYSPTRGIRVNSDRRIFKLQSIKKRTHEIKFAIGMCIEYSLEQERNTNVGIIIGWDYSCKLLNRESITKQTFPYLFDCRSNHLFCNCRRKIPHYRILGHSNVIATVPQDKMRLIPPEWINNIEFEYHFSEYKDNRYIANKTLKREYPSDTTACRKIITEHISKMCNS